MQESNEKHLENEKHEIHIKFVNPDKDEEDYKEKFIKISADFDNYKKRIEREKEDLSHYIRGEIFKSLFPVIDDLENCLQHENNCASMQEGIELIRKKLDTIIAENGLTRIPAVGETFNPELHEAVMTSKVDSPEFDDIVVEEIQAGYILNERLLRPAKVIVGKYEEKY